MPTITEAITSQFAQVREGERLLNIHYNDSGAGGEVVVLLHGSGPGATGWANFSRNIEPLTQAGYRVILPDFPGWGRSDSLVNTGSRSDLNAWVLDVLLEQLGIGRVHIVGNSMGGHCAVALALMNPARVGKLVLMGGGTGGAPMLTPAPLEGIKHLNGVYRAPTEENLRRMLDVFVFDPSQLTEELVQARLAAMLARKDHLDNFVRSLEANPAQFPDFGPRLSQVRAETLIIWGRNDRFVPLETGLRLLAGLPRSELHVFNQCGHWVQWEHAVKFNRMVADFLRGAG